MKPHNIVYHPSTADYLKTIPEKHRLQIISKIESHLSHYNPITTTGIKKLKNLKQHRLRSGDYRIIFHFDTETKTVYIDRIGNRKDIYD